jgi:hypothetical protein
MINGRVDGIGKICCVTSTETRNTYLDQVVAQQERLEHDLKSKSSRSAPVQAAAAPAPMSRSRGPFGGIGPFGGGPGGDAPANGVDVRITGFWRWKTVLVPPNAFVVHTRRGRPQPLHIGLGTSFRYNPVTDSYLVVPGAMQTILINAYCICQELQGLVVQAYVQWIIQDFATAYRKLDFSDAEDPMRVVNLQLKEQAEAAIKDKVATMGVHEVLSDKQPIIEELTARLRSVAEGEGGSDTGLGLRIVTVQIKEAVVSSARLWENLQKPFRSEQGRIARLAEIGAEEAVSEREMAASRERETRRMQHQRELDEIRADNDAASFDREAAERVRRAEREQEDSRTLASLTDQTTRHELGLERALRVEQTQTERLRIEGEQELRALEQAGELERERSAAESAHGNALLELEQARQRGVIDNDQTPVRVQARLVDALPGIVERMPRPKELRSVAIGTGGPATLSGLVAELSAVMAALRSAVPDRPAGGVT